MINKKIFQRIDADGNWLESVEVSPTLTEVDGNYQVEYIKPDDCIDADTPPDEGHFWDGNSWVLRNSITPEMPEPKVMRRIDNKGFFIVDEIIMPKLVDNVWLYPGIDDPDLVADPVPQESGFHKPKYSNGRWIEGATKNEIQSKRGADWVKFSDDFTASDLDDLISKTKNIAALTRFNRLMHTIPNVNTTLLCKAWNNCLAGLEESPSKKYGEQLITIVSDNNLPLTIGDDCTLSEVGND